MNDASFLVKKNMSHKSPLLEPNGTRRTITISGLAGSGTTTLAKLVADLLRFDYVNTGQIFRDMAKQRGLSVKQFGEYVKRHKEIDVELDRKQMELARTSKVVLEGRLAGLMAKKSGANALKIFLVAPKDVRIQRIANRDNISLSAAAIQTEEREKGERDRYIQLYNFDPATNLDIYDLVLDSGKMSPQELANIILKALRGEKDGKEQR